MLEFWTPDEDNGSWEHRAYWGEDLIDLGTNGTSSRFRVGDLPDTVYQWLMFIVASDDVNLSGKNVSGTSYVLYAGGANWDYTVENESVGNVRVRGLTSNHQVRLCLTENDCTYNATVPIGSVQANLNLYGEGHSVFPISGYFEISNNTTGSPVLEYQSPPFSDIWGGDVYLYSPTSFYANNISDYIHDRMIGQYEWQNGRNSELPVTIEGYSHYTYEGKPDEVKQKHGDEWINKSRSFDQYGNMIIEIDELGQRINVSYDGNYSYAYITNTTTNVTFGLGYQVITSSFYYDPDTGDMLNQTSPSGSTTQYEYDDVGRLVCTYYEPIDGVQGEYRVIHDDLNHSTTKIDDAGRMVKFSYDGLGRLVATERLNQTTNMTYSRESYMYDWRENVVEYNDTMEFVSRSTYDYLGRELQLVRPGNHSISYIYDDVNNTKTVIDENGNERIFLFDWEARLVEVREPLDNITILTTYITYDSIGNIIKVEDPAGKDTTREYDDLNLLVNSTYPDGTYEEFKYDDGGNLITKQDREGYSTNFTYDGLGRLRKIRYPRADDHDVDFTYDEESRITYVLSYTSGSGHQGTSLEYSYDARGRLTQEKFNWLLDIKEVTYVYDSGGNLSNIRIDDFGQMRTYTFNYSYDVFGRLSIVDLSSPFLQRIAKFTFRKDDQIESIEYGNSVRGDLTYDEKGRPARITYFHPVHGVVDDLILTYDPVGNLISMNNQSYSYDGLYRLTNLTMPGRSINYWYDTMGNRQGKSDSNMIDTWTQTYEYDSYDRLTSMVNALGTTNSSFTNYSYWGNGGLAHKSVDYVSPMDLPLDWFYGYNSEGLMSNVSRTTTGSRLDINYTYDYDRRRTRTAVKDNGAPTTDIKYVFKDSTVIYEAKGVGAGGVGTAYALAGGLRLAKITDFDVYYYHQDHLRGTRAVTNATGVTVFSAVYEPFGLELAASAPANETYKFIGQYYESTTSLYLFGLRYYDPEIGRFISEDPILGSPQFSQTLNRYAYAMNNPLRLTDPTGSFIFILIIVLIVVGVSLGVAATLNEDVAKIMDPVMTALGFVPVIGDFLAAPYWVARDASACGLKGDVISCATLPLSIAGLLPGMQMGRAVITGGKTLRGLFAASWVGKFVGLADDAGRSTSKVPRLIKTYKVGGETVDVFESATSMRRYRINTGHAWHPKHGLQKLGMRKLTRSLWHQVLERRSSARTRNLKESSSKSRD
jgi:RHS repeat-associated protein